MKFSVSTKAVRDAKAKLRAARVSLEREQPKVLEAVGVRILSFSKQDYVKKSRGHTGSDGIRWKRLQASTVLARLRERSFIAGGSIQKATKRSQSSYKALERSGAIKFTKRKSASKYSKGDTFKVTRSKGRVAVAAGSYAIGIDTGLQLNSASPGFAAAAGGGNIMRLSSTAVTVGYGRSYSPHFDKDRPLMPAKLPAPWRKACEDIVLRWANALIKGAIRG